MLFCDFAWCQAQEVPFEGTADGLEKYHNILSAASPQLVRVLRAYRIFPRGSLRGALVKVHFLLDVSWDELRAVICLLRPIIGEDEGHLRSLLISASNQTVVLNPHLDSILYDLTLGCLRFMKMLLGHTMDINFW